MLFSPISPTFIARTLLGGLCVLLASACATQQKEPGHGNALAQNTIVYAINAGGGDYTAQDGTVYRADHFVKGGSFGGTGDAITNTQDPALFQRERWGRFTYELPLKAGNYTLTLHLAETWFGPEQPGERVFEVAVEDVVYLQEVNLNTLAGHDTAYSVTLENIAVDDGEMTIDFLPIIDNASLRGLVVTGAPGSATAKPLKPAVAAAPFPPADCPQGNPLGPNDLVLFDGGPFTGKPYAKTVVGHTLELRHSWFLDEVWASGRGAIVEVQHSEDNPAKGSSIAYHSIDDFTGFKFTPPAALGQRRRFTFEGMDLYIESDRASPEFGIRVIKPGEPENNGHAPTATWLIDPQGREEIPLAVGCTKLVLQLPNTWSAENDVADRFIFEVREGWAKSDALRIRRIVLRGFSYAD